MPPLDRVPVEHFVPAFEASMEDYRAPLQALTDIPAQASFDNTIAAQEAASRICNRVPAAYHAPDKDRLTPERAMQLLEAVWTPAIARVREGC